MHADHHDIEEHLLEHGVKVTAVRLLVWRKIAHKTRAFSLKDIEEMMPEMDRSSIFRALKLFAEHDLLHEIDDGSGMCKYCVCRCEDSGHLNHVHFTCLKCGQTYCLAEQKIPLVDLPDGFVMQDVEYVMKGVCPKCIQRTPYGSNLA